eukprot:GHVN01035172.1.p1 GENE.GHVN01035172.1~~GHVN01035172.1.p1  ORF type:complete len:124 (-),score=20.97 GHVN01035172.1:83-454(-)
MLVSKHLVTQPLSLEPLRLVNHAETFSHPYSHSHDPFNSPTYVNFVLAYTHLLKSIYPNAWLADCTIENESRSVCASFDVQFSLAADTPRSSLIKLMKACERYVNCRPKVSITRALSDIEGSW